MKHLLLCLVYLLQGISFAEESPNKKYSANEVNFLHEGGYQNKTLVIKKSDNVLFRLGTSYGGFSGMFWSPNSSLLAVEDWGTKSTGTLYVISIEEAEVKKLNLPDYRLYISGWYKGKLGDKEGHSNFKWVVRKDSSNQDILCLSFQATGSLEGNSDIYAYRFDVVISFHNLDDPKILSIKPIKMQNKSQ